MENRNAKGPIVHFKCPSTDLKCWSKRVNLHFCRLVSTYHIEYVLGNFSSVKEKNGYFLPFLLFLLEMQNFPSYPSLNTQSCIKGLLVVQDFCFWAVQADGPVLKKKFWADYEQLLRAVFSCFQRQKKCQTFFKSTVASSKKKVA